MLHPCFGKFSTTSPTCDACDYATPCIDADITRKDALGYEPEDEEEAKDND